MFREIRTSERITEEDERRRKAYINIKPESELTIEELNAIVKEEFLKASKGI